MDKNNVRNIDIDDDEVVSEIVAPENILRMGIADDDDIAIYIKQSVYNQIEKYSADNSKSEVGGALVGKCGTIDSKPAVIIDNYIEAKHTDSTKSTLTFTPETWAYLYGEREKRFPQSKIVGWHRTHPGGGTSLSNYDMYIEENFFNSEFDVTYITDPINGQRAFHGKKKDRTAKMKGFIMYDDKGKSITVGRTQAPIQQRKPQPRQPKKKPPLPYIILVALILLLLIANIVSSVSTNIRLDKLIEAADKDDTVAISEELVENIIDALENGKKNENSENNEAETQKPESGTPIVVPEKDILPDSPDNNNQVSETDTPEQTNNNTENAPEDETTMQAPPPIMNTPEENTTEQVYTDANGIKYFDYTVQPGEFISLICDKFGIDYDEYLDDIIRESGITNPDSIEIGQVIRLPELN